VEYAFHIFNKLATDGTAMAVDKLLILDEKRKMKGAGMRSPSISEQNTQEKPPVIVCIGSDLAIGDSLGPLVGSMLKFKTQGLGLFLYGTLSAPVTAKEIRYMRTFLKETHKDSQVIAVDAAVGDEGDIGLIKIHDVPMMPGAGANKQLGSFGTATVLGIVAEKSMGNYALFNNTRLRLVHTMADEISEGIATLLHDYSSRAYPLYENVL
jgi:putative sporulation protein YyaC